MRKGFDTGRIRRRWAQAAARAWAARSDTVARRWRMWRARRERGARRAAVGIARAGAASLGRWRRAALLGLLALGAFGALTPSHLGPFLRGLVSELSITEFERADARSHGVALLDTAARYVGMLPADGDRDHLEALDRRTRFGDYAAFNDHKTVPVGDAPPYFWACLVHLEDRRRGTWDSPYGVSLRGAAKIPFTLAGVTQGGGSTLEMQLARSLWKQYRHNSNPALRKLEEWWAAPKLRRHLTDGFRDERRLRAWMAQHIALAQGVDRLGSIYGVEAAGRFLFGKGADALSPAEQLLLAAAVARPFRMRADVDSRRAQIQRFVGTTAAPGRALRCAAEGADYHSPAGWRPVMGDAAVRGQAAAQLAALAAGYDGPHLDPALAAVAPERVAHAAGPRFGPLALNAALIGAAAGEAAAQLEDHFGADPSASPRAHLWRSKLTHGRLTLDVAANKRFAEQASALAARWEEDLATRSGDRFDRTVTDYLLIAAIDEQGRVVRYLNASEDRLLFGRVETRPDWGAFGEGPYDPARETRTMGSTMKVGAALALAEAGDTDLAARWSNACVYGLTARCMSRTTGRGGWPSRTPEQVFAESLNAAVARRLKDRVAPERVDALAAALGMRVVDPAQPRALSLSLGRLTTRPADMLRLMSAARAYAEGDWGATVPSPHILEEITRFDPGAGRALGPETVAPPPRALAEIARPGPNPAASARFVRSVLSAPLCLARSREVRPSLARLGGWCAARRSDVALHLAKTGTVASSPRADAAGRNELDWWITGALRFADGRAYSYVVALGPGGQGRPFARDLYAWRLHPFVDLLLRDLAGAPDLAVAASD